MDHGHHHYDVRRFERGVLSSAQPDPVGVEEPLEIRVAGRSVSVTMRTPGHDHELAAGFLVGEGLVRRRHDIARTRECPESAGTLIDVLVEPGVPIDLASLTRHVFASSSCGVCGLATIDAVRKRFPPVADGPLVGADVLLSLPDRLQDRQPAFNRTGGLHGAALFESSGLPLVVREDVGRHNAVDKVIGHALLANRLPLCSHVLLVSGRASFEIVQKAVGAGVPIVAAVSAPSSLAVDLALEANVTLVGFLRTGRFNVYSHAQRIATADHAGVSDTAVTL